MSVSNKGGGNGERGMRYNANKRRYGLLDVGALSGIVAVLEKGALKYGDRDWEKGMPWTEVNESLLRHLVQYLGGEDFDKETGLLHIDHLATNVHFLQAYYRNKPQFDNRIKPWQREVRIALDVDGVLADFDAGVKKLGVTNAEPHHFHFSYDLECDGFWQKLSEDRDFWLELPALVDGKSLKFEPVAYVTLRPVATEVTMEWLERHHFPAKKVITVKTAAEKAIELKKVGAERFVDDKWENFVACNGAGIFTYLMDAVYNRKHDVGAMRIGHVNEALGRSFT